MKNIIAIILIFAGASQAWSQMRTVDGVEFEILTNQNLRINTNRYSVIDLDLSLLEADNLYRPLWRADQLEEFIYGPQYPITPGSVGRGVFTDDFTQVDAYGNGPDRTIRGIKIYETWYFHSGTDNPEYGYTLGVTPDDDTGGRHDTSREDVERRARDLASRTGTEIGVYGFTRITYDALINNTGAWIDVPGLDRITIHLPYRLVQTY